MSFKLLIFALLLLATLAIHIQPQHEARNYSHAHAARFATHNVGNTHVEKIPIPKSPLAHKAAIKNTTNATSSPSNSTSPNTTNNTTTPTTTKNNTGQ